MTRHYWLLPAAALLATGCNFDLPNGTLQHDGSGELTFTRAVLASSISPRQGNPSSCVSTPDAVSIHASAELKRSGHVEGLPDQMFDPMVPNTNLAASRQAQLPRDGFTWHCFNLSDGNVGFVFEDTGIITYRLSGLDNQDFRLLNTVDIVISGEETRDFAIFDIINDSPAEHTWQPLSVDLQDDPNTAILTFDRTSHMLGQRLLISGSLQAAHPGSALTVVDFSLDGVSMRDVPAHEDFSGNFYDVMADQVGSNDALGLIATESVYEQGNPTPIESIVALFTDDGETWERVALPSTEKYDATTLTYNAPLNEWLLALYVASADTTHVLQITHDGTAWSLSGTSTVDGQVIALGATANGTPLLLAPALPEQNEEPQSGEILTQGTDGWEVIQTLPLLRYFDVAFTGNSLTFLTGEPAGNDYHIGTLSIDLAAPDLLFTQALLDESNTYHDASLSAAGRTLVAVLDDSTILYSADQGAHWQTVSAAEHSLEAYFLSGVITPVPVTAAGGLLFQLHKDDLEALSLLDTTTGELALLNGNVQWKHYVTDGVQAYRLGLDRTHGEPQVKADFMALPVVIEPEPETPGGGRFSSKGGALYWFSIVPLTLLALRRRKH